MDKTRKWDLDTLFQERDKAKYRHDREDIDKAINRIMATSIPIRSLREKLAMAIAHNDRRAVNKFRAEINYHKQNETYGKEIS